MEIFLTYLSHRRQTCHETALKFLLLVLTGIHLNIFVGPRMEFTGSCYCRGRGEGVACLVTAASSSHIMTHTGKHAQLSMARWSSPVAGRHWWVWLGRIRQGRGTGTGPPSQTGGRRRGRARSAAGSARLPNPAAAVATSRTSRLQFSCSLSDSLTTEGQGLATIRSLAPVSWVTVATSNDKVDILGCWCFIMV